MALPLEKITDEKDMNCANVLILYQIIVPLYNHVYFIC